MEGNKVIHDFPFLDRELSKDTFIQNILDSPYISTFPPNIDPEDLTRPGLRSTAESTQDLIHSSDAIARIVPEFVSLENKYFKVVHVKVMEMLHHMDEQIDLENERIYVPVDVEIDEEYIAFLQRLDDGQWVMTTKEDSVVPSEDTSKWHDVMAQLELLNAEQDE